MSTNRTECLIDNGKNEGWAVRIYQCHSGSLKGEKHLILNTDLGFSNIAIMKANFLVYQNLLKVSCDGIQTTLL